MKIHWLSNAPWAKTGYGNQTALFLKRLQKLGHELSLTTNYGLQGGAIRIDNVNMYPVGFNPSCDDVVAANAKSEGADIIISLFDTWIHDASKIQVFGTPWIPWFPVDHEPLPNNVRQAISKAYKRISYSKFGQRMTEEAGLDCLYIPHGVDTNIYKPMDRSESRKLFPIPQDAFVVGMVAANKDYPSRKAFDVQFRAFKELRKIHNDAILVCHSNKYGQLNLEELAKAYGMQQGKDIFFPDPFGVMMGGYPDDLMARAYNVFDVLLSVSMGEGFGIPILEAQACGCPVIVGDWTSMGELCFSGWKIDKKDAEPFVTPLFSWQYIAHSGPILDALTAAYDDRNGFSRRAVAYTKAQAYDADLVAREYWQPVLQDIEDGIKGQAVSLDLVKF